MEQNLYRWAERAAELLETPAWTGSEETVTAILDLSKDAAHRVTRPAAPVTSFLAGVAVGLGGATGPDELRRAMTALVEAMPPAHHD